MSTAARVGLSDSRRAADDALRRIFRRGYPLVAGGVGGAERGLIFISFARSISPQFEFIFRGSIQNPDFPNPSAGEDRLLFQALTEQVIAGGY